MEEVEAAGSDMTTSKAEEGRSGVGHRPKAACSAAAVVEVILSCYDSAANIWMRCHCWS